MIKTKHFRIRIQLAESTITVLEQFFEFIDFFNKKEPNIVLELFLWYDRNILETESKKTLIKICEENKITLHDHATRGIKSLIDISTAKYDYECKFKLYYNDDNSFINSVFQSFNIISAIIYKEEQKYENRNNRQSALHKKNENKRSSMDDKK